jgi:ATP-dependent DNA helicase RecQ
LREIERLKALDPAADWSDFAVLARTHHMLQAARAWCEWRGVPYLLAEHGSNGAPELHKTREGLTLIRWLRRRPGRCLRHGVLRRWAARRRDPMNPWSELLLQCVAELEDAWNSAPIPRGQALEWLYEYGAETRTPRGGHLNLSTVHAVKGREFRHVLLLDGGDWGKGKREEECRLYYVGMTRAMETLTLCEGLRQTNPFTRALAAGEFLSRTEPAEWPPALPPLDVRYKRLGLADVDLGFAGRKSACDPVHQAIADLRVGDALSYVDTGQARELRDRRGVAVGRLSRQCGMPAGEILSVTVSAIVGRSRRQCRGTPHEERCRVEEWEVVLCHVAVDGGESSGDG